MNFELLTALAWMMVICSGVMAGVYLTFSLVIMRSLAVLASAEGMAAMKSINREILKTAFMPLFFGSTLVAIVMVTAAIWHWGSDSALGALVAGLIYAIGMFGVTATRNVPLNNRLEQTAETEETAEETWAHYLIYWTRWNTFRALACGASLVISMSLL